MYFVPKTELQSYGGEGSKARFGLKRTFWPQKDVLALKGRLGLKRTSWPSKAFSQKGVRHLRFVFASWMKETSALYVKAYVGFDFYDCTYGTAAEGNVKTV